MRKYEIAFIIRPNVEAGEVQEFIKGVIKQSGGEPAEEKVVGKRMLEYPIKKFNEGYYWILKAMINPASLKEIEREFKLNDSILRYMMIRLKV